MSRIMHSWQSWPKTLEGTLQCSNEASCNSWSTSPVWKDRLSKRAIFQYPETEHKMFYCSLYHRLFLTFSEFFNYNYFFIWKVTWYLSQWMKVKKRDKQVCRERRLIDKLPLMFFLNDISSRIWGSVVRVLWKLLWELPHSCY